MITIVMKTLLTVAGDEQNADGDNGDEIFDVVPHDKMMPRRTRDSQRTSSSESDNHLSWNYNWDAA